MFRNAGFERSVPSVQFSARIAVNTQNVRWPLFDIGGASATDRAHNLDRHWRNARTVANHNPRQWKTAMVGRWLLTGEPLPTTGLF